MTAWTHGRPYRRLTCLLAAGLLALAAAAQTGDEEAALKRLIQLGRHQEALERIEDRLRRQPDDPQILFLKGVVFAETGRTGEAAAIFYRLTVEHPDLAEPFNNLAVLHALGGRYEEARDALLAAIEANPSSSRYWENLGDLYLEMAAAAYGEAVEREPASDRVRARLELMHELLAEKPATASDPPPQAADAAPCGAAVAALYAWADAWSKQDVERYLEFYAPDFSPDGGVSRELWAAGRRRRIAQPRFIEITVEDVRVGLCDERRARLTFTQTYRSETYRDRVVKELWMSRPEGEWVIVRERSPE